MNWSRWAACTRSGDTPDAERVQELTPGMDGRWLVVTQGSVHEWDLDAKTYMWVAGPASMSGPFAFDSQPMAITRVERWPRVGSTSRVVYDDPTRPDDLEQWRQSSRIASITKIPPARPTTGGRMGDA